MSLNDVIRPLCDQALENPDQYFSTTLQRGLRIGLRYQAKTQRLHFGIARENVFPSNQEWTLCVLGLPDWVEDPTLPPTKTSYDPGPFWLHGKFKLKPRSKSNV